MSEDRLLEVAIAQFGAHGFDGASTREIAAAAGTAMSSITYHYGGKQGLYHAAARHIARSMADRVEPALAAPGLCPRERLLTLLDHFTALMLTHEAESWSHFVAREQARPTIAFDLLWEGGMSRTVGALVELVEAITGACPERARLLALSLMGTVLIHRAGRATVMRTLGWDAIDAPRAALVHAIVREVAQALLDAEAARAGQLQPC